MSFLSKLSYGFCMVVTGGVIGFLLSKKIDERKRSNETLIWDTENRPIEEIYYLGEEMEPGLKENKEDRTLATDPLVMINMKRRK